MPWKRQHLELDRRALGNVQKRVAVAEKEWWKLHKLVKLSVGKILIGDDVRPTDPAEYQTMRDEWLHRWHGFQEAVESLYTESEQVPYDGMWSVQRCFDRPSLQDAIAGIRKYGGDEKIETATFIPAEDFWSRINGRLRDLEQSLPSRRGEVFRWLRTRPDWIEVHPRTVTLVAIIAAAVVISLGIISARDLADLIRAIGGR